MSTATIIGIFLWALLPAYMAKKKNRSFAGFYILSLIISPLITTIIVLILHKKEDEKLEEKKQEIELEKVTENLQEEPSNKVEFCRICGNKLLDDSLFCEKCGNRVK